MSGREAFTVRELVVSLVIFFCILLVGAVVMKRVEVLTEESRSLVHAKKIIRGLSGFALEFDRNLPNVADFGTHARTRQGKDRLADPAPLGFDTATDNFSALIGSGFFAEKSVYYVAGEHFEPGRACPSPPQDWSIPLRSEEVGWNYVRGLTLDSPAKMPVILTRNPARGTGLRWSSRGSDVGGRWQGRIIVGYLDQSSEMIELDAEGVARDSEGRDITVVHPNSPYIYNSEISILSP